jgi:competence protein ComEC
MGSPLFAVALAFSLGILFGSKIVSSLIPLLVASFSLLLCSWLFLLRKQIVFSFWISLLAFLCMGVIWPRLFEASYGLRHLKTLLNAGKIDLNEPCRITGICSKSSVLRGIGEQVELDLTKLENRYSTYSTHGKVRLALYYKKAAFSGVERQQIPMGTLRPPEEGHSRDGAAPAIGKSEISPGVYDNKGNIRLAQAVFLNAGDRVEVLANLRRPKNFNNPGQFDYVSHLERQGVFLVGTIKNELLVTKLGNDDGIFFRKVHQLRAALLNQIEDTFSTKADVKAALKALLLGEKQGLSSKVEEDFKATGIYHVLVISGQHVAILAGFLFGLFRLARLPLPLRLLCTSLGLILYCLITEGQPSIIRATLMACVYMIVTTLDRDRSLLNSLSMSAMVLLIIDPFWLLDPGFRLSYSAVLAIALIGLPLLRNTTQPFRHALWQIEEASFDAHFSPRIADFRINLRLKVEWVRRHLRLGTSILGKFAVTLPLKVLFYLSDLLLLSMAVQLVFFVLMILYFHRVSLISVFLNILVIPLAGLIVPVGFLFFVTSLILPPVGLPLAMVCGWLTRCLLSLAAYFADSSWGNFRIPSPPFWLISVYFLGLTLFLVFRSKKILNALCAAATLSALTLILIQPFGSSFPPNQLEITFLDVRQGDSIFLRLPDSSTMLIDGGGLLGRSFGEDFSEEDFDVGEQVVSPFLWSIGVRALDVVILTHAHHDHMSGLNSVLSNFEVKEIWVGQNPYTPEYLRLLKKAVGKSVILRNYASGDELVFHGCQFSFMNPERGQLLAPTPSNNDSLAFRMKFGSRTFLLTGDIEKKIESHIIARNFLLHSDVLKVAHHGSRSSTTAEFLGKVNPVLSVISVADHSPFGHPHDEVLRRLKRRSSQVLRTDQNGAITVLTDGKQLSLKTFLD